MQLDVLEERVPLTSPKTAGQIQKLAKHIRPALPQALRLARSLEQRHAPATMALGCPAVVLLGWAWLRRKGRGPTRNHLAQSGDPAWRTGARDLLTAWDHAVRARSAVDNEQSMLRPPVAVPRTRSAALLAVLAVWHPHRSAPRGVHAGRSSFQRTDSSASDHQWLAALG